MHDKPGNLRLIGLDVLSRNAVGTNMRRCEHQNLARIGRICQGFLIPDHRRAKHDLTRHLDRRGNGTTAKDSTIF